MGGARELMDKWSQLSVSDKEEMDVEQRRDHYLQLVVSGDAHRLSDCK